MREIMDEGVELCEHRPFMCPMDGLPCGVSDAFTELLKGMERAGAIRVVARFTCSAKSCRCYDDGRPRGC
jgi:hypothetical protein